MEEVFVPHPHQGMTTESRFASAMEGWAGLIRNYIVTRGCLRQRGQQAAVNDANPPSASADIIWQDYDNSTNVVWSDGTVRTRTGTLLYSGTVQSYPPVEGQFKNQLYLSYAGEATICRNNATWGAFPFTLDALSASEIAGSLAYRGRAYFWGTDASDSNAQILEYGELDAITGNTQAYPVTQFARGGTIVFCAPLVVESGLQSEEVFCIFMNNGTVLVYSGDDPGADNWFLTGTFTLTEPLGAHAHIEVEGDILVMGQEYIYSMREVFNGGAKAAEINSLTANISTLYRRLAKKALGWKSASSGVVTPGAFWSKLDNTLIFGLGYCVDVLESDDVAWGLSGGTTWEYFFRRIQVVYCRETGGITLWDIPQFRPPFSPSGYYPCGNHILLYFADSTFTYHDGRDVIVEHEDLSLPDGDDFGYGRKHDYANMEMAWRTPIFMDRILRRATISAVRPFCGGSGSLGVTAGVIANLTDYLLEATARKYLAYDDTAEGVQASHRSLDQGETKGLYAPLLDVGMSEEFISAFLQINKVGKTGTFPSYTDSKFNEVYGMELSLDVGGKD